MYRMLSAIVVFLALAPLAAGQTETPEAKEAQRSLKKLIGKYAMAVADSSINECRASINIDAASFSITQQNSKTVAGGNFPRDESGGYLSSGPDREEVVPLSLLRFTFDFAALDASSVSVAAIENKDVRLIVVKTIADSAKVDISRLGKKIGSHSQFIIQSKSKGAEDLADALRAVIKTCSPAR